MKIAKRLLVILSVLALVGGGLFVWFRLAGNSPQALRAKADESFDKGLHSEALLQYRMLLGKDPQNAHAYYRAGMIWVERGAPIRAIPFLQQAQSLEPDDVSIRNELTKVLMGLGDVNGARREALEILKRDPTHPEALLLVANTCSNQEQMSQAMSFLDALDPATDPTYHLARAALLAREGQRASLKAALDRALEIAPESPKVQIALSNYHRATGNIQASLTLLEKATQDDNSRPVDRLQYAHALVAVGRTDDAMSILQDLAATHGDYLPASLAIAKLLAQQGKNEEALKALQNVNRLDPANLEARSTEASIHLAMGEPAKAVEVYENLDRAYPQAPRIKFELASHYLRSGEEVKARMTLKAAMNIAPELSSDHAEAIMRLAELELSSGKPAAASEWLVPLVTNQPDLRKAQLLLARAYAAEGRLEDAADLFRELIEEQPDNPLGHFMLGKILMLQQKNDDAVKSFETAQKLAPDDLAVTKQLVGLDLRKDDFSAAHQRLRHHLEKESPGWAAWLLEGSVFSAEGKWTEAETVLQKALDLKPESIAVYERLIDNYLRAGDPAKAIEKLEILVKEQPESTKHRMALCLLLEQQGEFERSAANYEALLESHPEFIPALNNLAYLYSVNLEALDKAEVIARRARALEKENPAVADTLGWILVQRGGDARMQEGLRLLQEAAAGLPDQPEVQYHLGVALSRTGAREESRRALKRAAAAEDDFPGKDEAVKLLTAFEGESTLGQSVEELEALRKNAPFNLPVRLQLGQIYETQGQTPEAIAIYKEVLKLDTKNLASLKALARLKLDTDPEQARDYARQAWEVDPSDPEASARLGYWSLRDGRHAQAFTLLKPSARTGLDPQIMADFADAAYGIGKIDEAREMMRKIPADAPQYAEAQTFLALTGEPGPGDLATVEAAADTALKSDPAHPPALVVRAAKLERSGEVAAAIAIYEKLRRSLPDFHPAATRLAALYADDPSKLDAAEALALESFEKGGNSPGLDRILGEILARKDKAETAITYLERAQKTTPLDAEGLYFLGKSYLDADRLEDGRSTLQRAIEAGLTDDRAAAARELIQSSGP